MAEKYGTIPKKFTKPWWEHVWTYYKWHILIPVLAIIAIVFTVIQTPPDADVVLTYAGGNVYSSEDSAKIEEKLSPLVSDADENDEKILSFVQYNFTGLPENIESESILVNRLFIALSEEESFLFIMDKETADKYAGENKEEAMFTPLDDWFSSDYVDEDVFSKNGVNYGIRVSDSPVFRDLGVNFEDQYLFLRFYPRKDQLEKLLPGYENAIEFANSLYQK